MLAYLNSALLMAVMASYAPEAPALIWRPVAGDTTAYKTRLTAKLPPATGAGEAKVGMSTTLTIREVRDDGTVVVEERQAHDYLSIDGSEMTGALSAETVFFLLSTFDREGRLLAIKSDNPEAAQPRMAEAMVILYPGKPMKVGEKWTYARKADPARGTLACETVYTYQGVELMDRWSSHKVAVQFRETEGSTPITHSGTVWLSVEKGEWVRAMFELKNVPIPSVGLTEVRLTVTRSG